MVALGIKVDRAATSIARKRVWMRGSLRGGGAEDDQCMSAGTSSRCSLSRSLSANTTCVKSIKTEARILPAFARRVRNTEYRICTNLETARFPWEHAPTRACKREASRWDERRC